MKLVAAMAIMGAAMVAQPAHAWFFFYIPGKAIDAVADSVSGSEGEHCVPEKAKIGDEIRLPNGARMVVQSISGTSYRCRDAAMPIRAKLAAAPRSASPTQVPATSGPVGALRPLEENEFYACVLDSATVGSGYYDSVNGNGAVKVVGPTSPAECPGTDFTRRAIVLAEKPISQPIPSQSPASPPQDLATSMTAQKLRDLNSLLKDGVITQDDYDRKKAELLRGF